MGKCKKCKHKNDYLPCDTCIHDPDLKDRFEPFTNADEIRSMSDEELAEFLATVKCRGAAAEACDMFWEDDSYSIDWLQQPAKTEGTE